MGFCVVWVLTGLSAHFLLELIPRVARLSSILALVSEDDTEERLAIYLNPNGGLHHHMVVIESRVLKEGPESLRKYTSSRLALIVGLEKAALSEKCVECLLVDIFQAVVLVRKHGWFPQFKLELWEAALLEQIWYLGFFDMLHEVDQFKLRLMVIRNLSSDP